MMIYKKKSMKGYVYVLSNPSMPNLYKIGMTTRTVEERVKELDTTGVPTPYKIELSIQTNNPKQFERFLHRCFNQNRVNNKREFFNVSLSQIKSTIAVRCTQKSINHFGVIRFVEKKESEKAGYSKEYKAPPFYHKWTVATFVFVLSLFLSHQVMTNLNFKLPHRLAAETYVSTTVNSLRIRQQPSLQASVVGELKRDECVKVILKEDGWYMIQQGWISAEFVKKTKCG